MPSGNVTSSTLPQTNDITETDTKLHLFIKIHASFHAHVKIASRIVSYTMIRGVVMVQGVGHQTCKPGVSGSIPTWGVAMQYCRQVVHTLCTCLQAALLAPVEKLENIIRQDDLELNAWRMVQFRQQQRSYYNTWWKITCRNCSLLNTEISAAMIQSICTANA